MDWNPHDFPRGRGHVELSVMDRLAVITFDNPGARNAMSVGMMADIVRLIDELESADVSAVLMRGSPGAGFCAGGDLKDVRTHLMNSDAATGMPAVMGDALDRLASLNAVIVAAVEGAALGGGAELVTAADWVIAADDAHIGFVHAALGVSPGWGGGRRLIRKVGHRSAFPVLVEARKMTTAQSAAVGLVDEVVSSGGAEAAARAWIARILSKPSEAVRGALRILRAGRDAPDSMLNVERDVFRELWGGPAHCRALDGVKAGE
jgi:ethylmalonyl-CoA/methylmalonyl-CoA decarboxylase